MPIRLLQSLITLAHVGMNVGCMPLGFDKQCPFIPPAYPRTLDWLRIFRTGAFDSDFKQFLGTENSCHEWGHLRLSLGA